MTVNNNNNNNSNNNKQQQLNSFSLLSPINTINNSSSNPPAEYVRLPSLVRKMESRGVTIGDQEELVVSPSLSPIKKKTRVTVARSNTKEFKGLVALINHSSKSNNPSSGTIDVLKKWEELTRI